MFERFTDRARRVVVLAQEQARRLDHDYIGTEHLLLGLIEEGEGLAAQALESLGIELDAVRAEVEETVGRGTEPPSGHIPFTPRAKKVLELSLREALQLGHNYIGTEHILLGLIREGEGIAAQILVKRGAGLGVTRERVTALLTGEQATGGTGPTVRTVLLNSLRSENARLRREIDHLRQVLTRLGAEDLAAEETGAAEVPAVKPALVAATGASARACSFCGKPDREVAKLIAGPGVHICDDCIRLCAEILAEAPSSEPPSPEPPSPEPPPA